MTRFAQALELEVLRNGLRLGGSLVLVHMLRHSQWQHHVTKMTMWRNLRGIKGPRRSDSLPKGLDWLSHHTNNAEAQISQGPGTAVQLIHQGSLQFTVVS